MRARGIEVSLAFLLLMPPALFCQNTKENADFKLAINLYNDGLFDLAGEQLKQFINAYPATPQGIDARFYLGLTQLKLKKYDDSRMTFQTFALTYQDNPKAPEAWWNVGESYAAIGNIKEAALAFERVKVFHPKHKSAPDALLKAARFFMLAGEKEDARRVLRVILQEYPTSGAVMQARTELARMYFQEGNLDLAQNELKRVIDGDPSAEAKAQALLILGNIYQATGKTDQAEANYEEILSKFESSAAVQGAHLYLGKLLADQGKNLEAVDHFKKAAAEKGSPDSLFLKETIIGTGDAYTALKDYPNAVTAYERFLVAFPKDDRTYEVLGKIAETASRGKNFRRSNEVCNQILRSGAPEQYRKRALIRMAGNALEQNAPLQAAQHFNAFIDQYPDDPSTPEVLFRLATLSEKQLKDPRKAATWFELLSSRSSQSTYVDDALMGAGRCYEQLKETDRAVECYRDLISRYPASEFRPQAEEHVRKIETFEAKDKDAGLEKLALLIGDVVVEQDKASLAFRLGEIYFNDLKNFQAAANQFTNALKAGLKEPKIADALFMRSRSFELLGWNDPASRPRAVEGYQAFLKVYPADSRAPEAALSLFTLRSTSLAEGRAAYNEVLSQFPNLPNREPYLMILGRLQEGADSLGAALSTYGGITASNPSSVQAEEAAFRRIGILDKLALPDSALAEASAYIAAFPSGEHTPSVLLAAADLYAKKGNPSRAADLYQQLANDFWYTDIAAGARRNLADAYGASGNYTAAIALYSSLLQQSITSPLAENEVDPSLLLALGTSYHLGGKAAEAKKVLFELLSREQTGPLAGEAYMTLGLIYRDEGSLDNAASYFRQAEAAAPGIGATRDIANLLFERGDYADAIRQFTQLGQAATIDADRQYYDARVIVARLRERGPAAVEKEITAFRKKYKETDEDLATFELEKGNYLFSQEDYAKALKAFQVVTGKYEETAVVPDAQYWIGKTLEATEKPQEAIAQLDKLIKEHPRADIIPRTYFALGNIYYNAEKWDEAIRNYKQVLDNPKSDPALQPLAMSNLIETYDAAGAYDAALSLTRKYLDLYPNSEDAFDKRIKIGILYNRLGYFDQAVLQLQSLLDEAGSDLEGEIRYYIADANYNKGDFQQAILDFLKVPYLVTKKGKIDWTANSLYMAGQSYEKMGRYDQALTMYRQIVDRPGIDATYKTAARKEIDRVKLVLKKK
jgi:TolA-binding protein